MTCQSKPFRFTNTSIESLPNNRDQVIYKDTQLAHLGILVSLRSKSFFVQATYQGRSTRHTIGKFPYITVDEARKKGTTILARIFNGDNPNDARRAERELQKLTLAEAFKLYKETRTSTKERTLSDYEGALKRYFRDWLNKPLVEVTPQMILKRAKSSTHKAIVP
jgi:hypothetical protein